MYIVGITGPIGAGKTLAMQALQEKGALALDCDEIYHEQLSTNTEMTGKIKARFPGATTDGRIDRKKLGDMVWGDPAALADLNGITHKYVLNEVDRRIGEYEKQGGSIAAVCAIALIEAGYAEKCNAVIAITAPVETRVSRITARDSMTREQALARINAQQPESFYIENSGYIIVNKYENIKKFKEAIMEAVMIDKWFSGHTDEMLKELEELVAINSVRGESEDGAPFGKKSREVLSIGQKLLEKNGFDVTVFEDMVITVNLGPAPAKLGILTHLDIVDAGENWKTDPFKLTNIDGRLFGRGVLDNKGPSIAALYALLCVRELYPDLKHGVQLIFGSAEETGFSDIASYMEKNAMPPNVFSPDAEFPVVNTEKGRFMPSFGAKWEKDEALPRIVSITGGKTPNIVPNKAVAAIEGISRDDVLEYCRKFSEKTGVSISAEESDGIVTITATGAASHASRPHVGKNAQTALVGMLAAMPFATSKGFDYVRALARLFPHGDYYGDAVGLAAQDEISGKTTVNFGVLRYDEQEFSAGFDTRSAVCADKDDLLEMTRKVLQREGMEITNSEYKKSHHTPADTPFVQTLLEIYKQYTGKPGKCLCMGGLTYVHDIPGGVAFGCAMETDDDNNVHGANEYIDLDQLVMCAKMFTQAIVEVCEGS